MVTRSEGNIPKQELKRRLSAWAGFKWDSSMNTWIYPNGNIGDSPDFVDNLDSCFRWLLPHVKLIRIDYVASGISPKGEITEWQVGIVSYVNPKLNQVDGFARIYFDPNFIAVNQAKLNAYLDPAVERFKQLPDEATIQGEMCKDDFENALITVTDA